MRRRRHRLKLQVSYKVATPIVFYNIIIFIYLSYIFILRSFSLTCSARFTSDLRLHFCWVTGNVDRRFYFNYQSDAWPLSPGSLAGRKVKRKRETGETIIRSTGSGGCKTRLFSWNKTAAKLVSFCRFFVLCLLSRVLEPLITWVAIIIITIIIRHVCVCVCVCVWE